MRGWSEWIQGEDSSNSTSSLSGIYYCSPGKREEGTDGHHHSSVCSAVISSGLGWFLLAIGYAWIAVQSISVENLKMRRRRRRYPAFRVGRGNYISSGVHGCASVACAAMGVHMIMEAGMVSERKSSFDMLHIPCSHTCTVFL